MTSNSFPKQYILDRIDARVARLKSFQDIDDKAIKARDAEMAGKDVEWIHGVPAQLDALKKKAQAVAKKLPSAADTAPAAQTVLKLSVDLSALLSQLEKEPPSRRRRGYNTPEPQSSINARIAYERLPKTTRELVALEHARAYLQDTPVGEFSWTALKALGLLDAVKFDLFAAKEQKPTDRR